jgi:hypothetical protein
MYKGLEVRSAHMLSFQSREGGLADRRRRYREVQNANEKGTTLQEWPPLE